MAFLLRNGAVFLHLPKTGGTWVKSVLDDFDLIKGPLGHAHNIDERLFWHDKLHHDLKVLRYMFRRAIGSPRAQPMMKPGCFKFCFVREPLTWYESWWRMTQSPNMNWKGMGDENDPYKWTPYSMLKGLESNDFNTFMHNVNKKRPGFVTEMYGWYVRPGIGFVGKTENLRRDLVKAFALMKLDVDESRVLSVPAVNEGTSHSPKPEWDPKIKRQTLRLEYVSYLRFDYPVDEQLFAEKA